MKERISVTMTGRDVKSRFQWLKNHHADFRYLNNSKTLLKIFEEWWEENMEPRK